MGEFFEKSELILNPDGSAYHVHLLPEHIPDTIITVGDQDRVEMVSKHFDQVYVRKNHREFVSHFGRLGNTDLLVISTGIGTDNIDIVINEIDALVNIDLETRKTKSSIRQLNFIRIGTSGTIQGDIGLDSILMSRYALGMDGLLPFYDYVNTDDEKALLNQISPHLNDLKARPTLFEASTDLWQQFWESEFYSGITLTAAGFYAPQGRQLRFQERQKNWIEKLSKLDLSGQRLTNIEMETAGIYGLGRVLGHRCLSINAILANRTNGEFSKNPKQTIERTIDNVLSKVSSIL